MAWDKFNELCKKIKRKSQTNVTKSNVNYASGDEGNLIKSA